MEVEPAALVEPEADALVEPVAELPAETDVLTVAASEDAEPEVPAEAVVPEPETPVFVLAPTVDPVGALTPALVDEVLLCDELQLASNAARGNTINTFFIIKKF